MKCPCCGIEMLRKTAAQWVCRNPKCIKYDRGNARYKIYFNHAPIHHKHNAD